MRTTHLALLTVAAAFTLSCAADVEDIDRTQPGKLKKSALVGEWYFRQTVVDVPYTSGVTFIGEQSALDRVRWEISEDLLTAYRSYERVTGAEQPSQLDGVPYQGAPVAAFRILRHFDVVRNYNEATGEQSNVISENDYDRPWYERDYIRVDWSTNLVGNFELLAAGDSGLGVLTQSASYVVTHPNDPDAPVFAQRRGEGWRDVRDPMVWGKMDAIDYFDMTLKLQVTPETFPIYYDDGSYEEWPACWFYEYGPWDCASQTIKVRASFLKVTPSDYEPLYYPDNYVARDANGDAIRVTWDEDDQEMRRCAADEWEYCSAARVPMFDRFGYFRTERETYDRDYELTQTGKLYLINRFNMWEQSRASDGSALPYGQRAVRPITYHLSPGFPEALVPAATEVEAWWNDAFSATVNSLQHVTVNRQVFDVQPNDYRVEDGVIVDHGQRNGDLRYNHFYWVDDPQFESLLGYGPSSADPLTGEIIAADAYVYGAAIDSYAAHAADVVDLMRGQLDPGSFLDGENVAHAVAGLGRGPSMSREAMQGRVSHVMERGLGERLRGVRQAGRASFQRDHDVASARLALAKGKPQFESLWNKELELAIEKRLGRRLPVDRLGARLARALERHRTKLGAHAVCLRGFEDASVLHLLNEFGDAPRDQVVQKLREYLFKSTGAHELGHTFGLRHNFAASTDAINYFDEYWQIRDPAAQALDLPTRDEIASGLREYAYSSIMDYGAKFMSDIRGIGKYDRAAIKFGYGQLVETFVNEPNYDTQDVLNIYPVTEAVQQWSHYTDIPKFWETSAGAGDGAARMAERVDIPMTEVVDYLTLAPGAQNLVDALVPYKFCSDEYAGFLWDCDTWDEGADPYEIVSFAEQDYRDYYIFRAFRRDKRYLDPIDYYYGVYGRTMQPMARQYQLWLYDQWTAMSEWDWLHGLGTNATSNPDWNLDPKGGLARTAAAVKAVNFLTEVLATPEPGSYYKDPASNVLLWWTNGEDRMCEPTENSAVDPCSDVYVPLGEGRYRYTEFDDDTGYYWYERVRVVGSFWDKVAAIETLADPTSYFLGVDDVANATAYVLGFNVAFPNAIETLFGAVMLDDYKKYAFELGASHDMTLAPLFDTIAAGYGDTAAPDRVGPFIDPATNFTIALYALYYGMALLNSNFDQTFNDGAKIWLEGAGESFTPVAGAVTARFENPYNGRAYLAMRLPKPGVYSVGYEMVSRADQLTQALATAGCTYSNSAACSNQRWELQNIIENIEIVRGYYDVFGYAWW